MSSRTSGRRSATRRASPANAAAAASAERTTRAVHHQQRHAHEDRRLAQLRTIYPAVTESRLSVSRLPPNVLVTPAAPSRRSVPGDLPAEEVTYVIRRNILPAVIAIAAMGALGLFASLRREFRYHAQRRRFDAHHLQRVASHHQPRQHQRDYRELQRRRRHSHCHGDHPAAHGHTHKTAPPPHRRRADRDVHSHGNRHRDATQRRPRAASPRIGGCQVFPANNAWNQSIKNAPLIRTRPATWRASPASAGTSSCTPTSVRTRPTASRT